MSTSSLVIVPSEMMEALLLPLRAQLAALAGGLTAGNIATAMGALAPGLLERLRDGTPEREVIVWARSEPSYLAAWTSREPEAEVVQSASAAGGEGLVSEVFESRRTTVRAEPELRAGDWTNLAERRGLTVTRMAASPVVVFDRCAAVVTIIHYRTDAGGAEPNAGETSELAMTAGIVSRLLEDRLLRAVLGLEAL
jgi:hypothetical protein